MEFAFKIKNQFLNCKLASDSAKKAVSFEKFDELFEKHGEKDSLADYAYFKKFKCDTRRVIFISLKKKLNLL